MEGLPIPLSRVEQYLAVAAGMVGVSLPEKPLSRLEQFLAVIAGDTSVELPTPHSLTEMWLAYVAGVTPTEPLAVEGAHYIDNQKVDTRYLAVAANVPGATLPATPQNRKEMYWVYISGNAPIHGVLKYATGTSIALTDVVKGIEELQYVYGDSAQQTYTGKNLFNKDATPNYTYGTSCAAIDTGVRITRTSTTINTCYTRFIFNVENYVGQTLTLSANASASSINVPRIIIGTCDSDGSNRVEKDSQQGTGTLSTSYTIEAGDQYIYINFYANCLSQNVQVGDYADYDDAQLELSATPTSYEPYVGSIPAPNPSYPQTVQTVTGTQTITVTDGDVQNIYTVDLGSIELCKIGTHQDYIYKSGDDWYVHKECGKVVLDGSQGLDLRNTSANNTYTYSMVTPFDYKVESGAIVISDHFICLGTTAGVGAMYNSQYYLDKLGIALYYNSGLSTTQSVYINSNVQLPTWLSTHNTTVYYALATPTDTKITDSTLIEQLNAIDNATLPKPVAYLTVTATGTNLPGAIKISYYGESE